MGTIRFLLAVVVVLFHTTKLNWLPGRMAVDGFFLLSGYVITLTFSRNYLHKEAGTRRFFTNRFLRLAPPYAVAAVATAALIVTCHYWLKIQMVDVHPYFFTTFDTDVGGKLMSSLKLSDITPTYAVGAGGVPLLTFGSLLVPQGWSLGVEASFYLAAPLIAFTVARRGIAAGAVWLAIGLIPWSLAVLETMRDHASVDHYFYQNAFTAFPLFALGALAVPIRAHVTLKPAIGLAVGCTYVAALLIQQVFGPPFNTVPTPGRFIVWQLITAAAMFVVVLAESWGGAIANFDRRLGNLSYPIYVTHGIAIIALPLLGLAISPRGWSLQRRLHLISGTPYTVRYGIVIVAGTIALAWIMWRLVESPIAGLRTKVRNAEANETSIASATETN